MDSIIAVNKYRGFKKISDKNGQFFKAEVEVINERGKSIYCEETKCMISYNIGYGSFEITIEWGNEPYMLKQGLYKGYSTTFQKFIFCEPILTIEANEFTINIE